MRLLKFLKLFWWLHGLGYFTYFFSFLGEGDGCNNNICFSSLKKYLKIVHSYRCHSVYILTIQTKFLQSKLYNAFNRTNRTVKLECFCATRTVWNNHIYWYSRDFFTIICNSIRNKVRFFSWDVYLPLHVLDSMIMIVFCT